MNIPNALTENRVTQLIRAELKRWHRKNPSTGGGASALDDLTDVNVSSPTTDQHLVYNGSAWVNQDDDANIDGGAAYTTYLTSQNYDGGTA
ncbi:MAG: hypothetical protein GY872_04990 [Roseibacillus sp.]|nr:hypothetical protein [Roseibacillus sp.]